MSTSLSPKWRAAEVAEQTVHNYFAIKEQLVTDHEEQVQDRLVPDQLGLWFSLG